VPVESLASLINEAAFVAFYDLAAVESDNSMSPLDWSVSTLLQAPIRRYDPFRALSEQGGRLLEECNQALAAVGDDVPLCSEKADAKQPAVRDCLAKFMSIPGIGPSIAAKTLHKKRPNLIPVIDDFVSTLLIDRRGSTLGADSMSRLIFETIRGQVGERENAAALSEAASLLTDKRHLTAVRIFDIAAWTLADGHRDLYGLPRSKKWQPSNLLSAVRI
jgi:Family of unknown function (DUF6308)